MSAESGGPREVLTLPQRQPVPRFRAPVNGSCIRLCGRPVIGSNGPGVPQPPRARRLSIRNVQTRINIDIAFQLRDAGTSVRAVGECWHWPAVDTR
jgi:hypothetical protein